MKIAYYPRDETELMMLRMEFESTDIPYQIWKPGDSIPIVNSH